MRLKLAISAFFIYFEEDLLSRNGVILARKSQHCLKKNGTRGGAPWLPDLKEWKKICRFSAYDTQICKYFQVSQETFYAFLDREHFKEEQDNRYKSEYLESHKIERNKTRDFIASKFIENIKKGDISSTIFGMKTFNGMIESQYLKLIELKKIEVAFKTKQFMANLAKEFNLNYEQLNEFAEKFFRDEKLDII